MNLATLLIELKPLLEAPDANWPRIVELLENNRSLAEYQVARFFASRHVMPTVERLAQSPDPRERRRAARMIPLTFPKSAAGRVLRGLVKDADDTVRASARGAVATLGLDDVALPDTRFPASDWSWKGKWNRTGWAFGLFGGRYPLSRRKPKPLPASAQQSIAALPPLADAAAVAKLVGLKGAKDLRRFMRPGVAAGSGYVEFEVPKASGGVRTISAPRAPLKRVQRAILREVLDKLPAHDAAHGFVKGRSVVTNARPHQGAALVVKTDLRDFFPTVHYRRVVGLFRRYGYSEAVAALLAGLVTHRGRLPDGTVLWPGALPQGAPTSPAIANLVCRRLDARLAGLARTVGASYTRYADDLTFSFAKPPERGVGRFLWWVDQVCQQEGFVEHVAKRRVLRASNQQRITGVVVNSGLHVPRAARRRFRAILANCRAHGVASQARGREDFRAYLRGFAAYVKMVQPEHGGALVAEVRELLAADKA